MSADALPSRRALRARARHEAVTAARSARSRGRHASARGDGFGRLVTLTTLGALVPGTAQLAAGRRRVGWLLLATLAAVLAGVVGLYATGRLDDVALRLAVRPDALLAIAVAAAAGGLVWAAVIVAGHRALRRGALGAGQNLLAFALVTALVTAVLVPAGTVGRYALAQRSVVLNVFGDEGRDPNLAAPDAADADPWEDVPRLNVMLLGTDDGEDRQGIRPDTIIVASIDTRTGDTVLFNLPRNLPNAPFPKGTPAAREWPNGFNCDGLDCHLNAVWTWADANPDLYPGVDEPGLTATQQVVSEILGLQIDYYAMVNMAGFEDVVDALGGLEITVARRVPIGITGQRPVGWIEPGRRVLNGHDALWFARSRADSSNYARMKRQQCVIAAAAEQIDPVALARAFPRLAASAERNVRTDIPADHLDAFVELARRVQGGTLRSLPFTDENVNTVDPDYGAIRDAVEDALVPPAPEPPPASQTTAPGTAPDPAPEPSPTVTLGRDGEPVVPDADPDTAQDVDTICG
ncbi:LCP family protein [Thalassiella azotivora]